MKQIDICPQPIYSFSADKELLEQAQNIACNEEYISNGSHTNQHTKNVLLYKDDKCSKLVSWFESCVNEVKLKCQYECDKLSISQMWINKSTQNQWHHLHYHQFSILSGIFYVTKSDADTWFSIDNHWAKDMIATTLSLNEWNSPQCLIHKEPTTPGNLILFPSHLAHSVSYHTLPHPRFTFSFNTFPTGEVGRLNELTGFSL